MRLYEFLNTDTDGTAFRHRQPSWRTTLDGERSWLLRLMSLSSRVQNDAAYGELSGERSLMMMTMMMMMMTLMKLRFGVRNMPILQLLLLSLLLMSLAGHVSTVTSS